MQDRPVDLHLLAQVITIFGRSGSGKSSLASTAPRPFFLDSNDGLTSIGSMPGREHVRHDRVRKMADLDEVYQKLRGTHRKADWSKRYDTAVHDHFDELQAMSMDELGAKALKKDASRDIDEWQQKEYGIMGNRLRRYLRKMKQLPQHKILICAERTDFETGVLKPAIIGAMQHQLPYYCDHYAYLRVGKKGVRYLHLDGTDEFEAKTRAWWLGPEWRRIQIDQFDHTVLTRLLAAIQAGPQHKTSTKKTSALHVVPAGRTRQSVARRG